MTGSAKVRGEAYEPTGNREAPYKPFAEHTEYAGLPLQVYAYVAALEDKVKLILDQRDRYLSMLNNATAVLDDQAGIIIELRHQALQATDALVGLVAVLAGGQNEIAIGHELNAARAAIKKATD
jgi:hypothetical protein